MGGIGLIGVQPHDPTLDAVVELGFQKAFTEFCVRRGGHNSATVAYWLLAANNKHAAECKTPELQGRDDTIKRPESAASEGERIRDSSNMDSPVLTSDAVDDAARPESHPK